MSSLYLSTGAFTQGSLPEMAAACESLGIPGLELSSGVPWHPDLLPQLAQLKNTTPLHLLVHNYFPPPRHPFVLNLAAADSDTLARSRQHVRAALQLSATLGAPFYSVHSGFALQLAAADLGNPDAQTRLARIPHPAALNTFTESVRELAACAGSLGLRLLLENNVLAPGQVTPGEPHPLLLAHPAEIARFFHDLAIPGVGLLLDVGHAKVAATALSLDPARYFHELAPFIAALHLSDNDGTRDTNQPFTPASWFMPHLPALRHLPMVIEVYRLTPAQITRQHSLLLHTLGR